MLWDGASSAAGSRPVTLGSVAAPAAPPGGSAAQRGEASAAEHDAPRHGLQRGHSHCKGVLQCSKTPRY